MLTNLVVDCGADIIHHSAPFVSQVRHSGHGQGVRRNMVVVNRVASAVVCASSWRKRLPLSGHGESMVAAAGAARAARGEGAILCGHTPLCIFEGVPGK